MHAIKLDIHTNILSLICKSITLCIYIEIKLYIKKTNFIFYKKKKKFSKFHLTQIRLKLKVTIVVDDRGKLILLKIKIALMLMTYILGL